MNNYYDKILGCWLGKCLGGNIGQPFEGMKQRMHIEFTREFVEKAIPNDDLDLQILWLDVINRKGLDFNGEDLADAFAQNCPYSPGEYAYFKRNYHKNIMPPLSGSFNNEFFNAGMGSPIRSEIWACLFPDEPARAVEYAKLDSTLDHYEFGDSYYGEVFLTALECYCFQGGDTREIAKKALAFLPADCAMHKLVTDVLSLCEESDDMAYIQKAIVRKHGHSESCMARQNIGFLLAAFFLYGADFKKGVEEAVKCGFDADCTGATLGAMLGILLGGKKLQELFGIEDAEYRLGVKSPRTDFRVSSLAKEVFGVYEKIHHTQQEYTYYTVKQLGDPCISFGEEKRVSLEITPPKNVQRETLTFTVDAPAKLVNDSVEMDFTQSKTAELIVRIENVSEAPEGIKGEVYCKGKRIGRFGLSVRRPWRVYGPYWKNEVVIPELKEGDRYGRYILGENREDKLDHMRLFHLSCLPDENAISDITQLANEEYELVEVDTDIVKINESVGFFGNAVYYFETVFVVEKDMRADAQFGRNVPFKVWLNGELITQKDGNEHFYYETRHRLGLPLKKGENTLLFMVVNNTDNGKFSYEFVTSGPCSDQYAFKIKNLK